jgi:hypothetical protein
VVKVRRPSLPTVIALLALFIALDGPSHAQNLLDGKQLRKGSVTTRAIKDRTVKVRDLTRGAFRELKRVRNNSITEAKLANRSVTIGKLMPGAVRGPAIADRSVGTADLALGSVGSAQLAANGVGTSAVADGSLGARDIARYYGRFTVDMPTITAGACWSAAPANLAAERAGADISRDLVIVTPDATWPERQLTFTVKNDGNRSRFVIAACNEGGQSVPRLIRGFRYAVIDLP